MDIEPFDCSATQTLNVSCILGIVVGDSLRDCKLGIASVHISYYQLVNFVVTCWFEQLIT